MAKCDMCQSVILGPGTKITLTEEERKIPGSQEFYIYCNPCDQILKDPQAASSILTNLLEKQFRQNGVVIPKSVLAKHRTKLLGHIK